MTEEGVSKVVLFRPFWCTLKQEVGAKAKWSRKKCLERELISETEVKQPYATTRILKLVQFLPYFLFSPSCFQRRISSHVSGAFPLIQTWPVICSDSAGFQDIYSAAFAIWSCLPSTLPCRLRFLENCHLETYLLLPHARASWCHVHSAI